MQTKLFLLHFLLYWNWFIQSFINYFLPGFCLWNIVSDIGDATVNTKNLLLYRVYILEREDKIHELRVHSVLEGDT